MDFFINILKRFNIIVYTNNFLIFTLYFRKIDGISNEQRRLLLMNTEKAFLNKHF